MFFRKACSLLLAALLFAASVAAPVVGGDEKLKAEDVVEKSLAALGSAEKRAAAKSRVVTGICRLRMVTGQAGVAQGRATLVSGDKTLRIAFSFPNVDYWGEQFVFDGEKTETGYIQPGRRSQLGAFINLNSQIVREGLLGGVLTTRWPLLDLTERQPKLNYDGIKKFDGRELHRLSYRMKKGQGLITIYLYFDPANFRHTASNYIYTSAAPMGPTIEQSSQQQETRNTLEEFFDDFREVDGLVLPTRWRLRMTTSINQQTAVLEWEVQAENIAQNVPLAARDFVIEQRAK